MLAAEPLAGHLREDLSPQNRPFRYWTVKRRFLVVYQPRKDGVDVVRVFDGAQDVAAALRADERHGDEK